MGDLMEQMGASPLVGFHMDEILGYSMKGYFVAVQREPVRLCWVQEQEAEAGFAYGRDMIGVAPFLQQ